MTMKVSIFIFLQKSSMQAITTSLSIFPSKLYACQSLFLLNNPNTLSRLLLEVSTTIGLPFSCQA